MRVNAKILLILLILVIFLQANIKKLTAAVPSTILLNIPFTAQAPLGRWSDMRQEDGCEEASSLMAISWVKHKNITLKQAEKDIIAISQYELKKYGGFKDTSAADTVARIINDYFKYQNATSTPVKSANEIISELKKGQLVIAPVNGQKLKNPNYKRPGPLRHMLLIKGYDFKTGEFITNDAGTKRGNNYRYKFSVLENALRDYLTGNKKLITQINKTIIIIKPEK